MAQKVKDIKLDSIDLSSLSDREKQDLALALRRKLGGKKSSQKRPIPTTDDELWDYIKEEIGDEVPRVAVCDGHDAPFDFMKDYYFERERAILVMSSRESGKTRGTAIINYIFAETKPNLEVCTFADIEAQSNKSYTYIKNFVYTRNENGEKALKPTVAGDPLRKETNFKNGSKLEVIIGSKSGVNSPHPQKVHADEIDLMDEEIFFESRSMSSSKTLPDGSVIRAQDIATSTRKSNKGLMQKIINEVESAKKHNLKPPWRIYKSCLYEVAHEVSNCRMAPKDKREARLTELGKNPCELCECNKVAKGEWVENVPRTLDTVCKGKLFKSRGWMSYDDIVGKFTQNSPQVWVAQLECRRPMADGLYLPTWSRERYCVRGYEPRPEYGLIWMGVDWGGGPNSISAVLWIQGPLHQPIQVNNTVGTKTVIPQGAFVIFKEINESSIGATRLADKVVRQEIQYKNRYGGSWRVKARFADKAGAQQRADWREHDPPLQTKWYLSGSYLDPTIECLQSLVVDSLLYVDDQNCPGTCDDFESWRSRDNKEIHDNSSHNPAACLVAGTKVKTSNGNKDIEKIKVGDLVYTRDGLKEVEWSGKIYDTPRPVMRVEFSDGSHLIGTDDHPVWVEGKGFVQLAALRYGDIIESWKNQSNVEKTCGTRGLSLLGILNQRIQVIKGIIRDIIVQKENNSEIICTGISGKIIMGRYQMGVISTILMKIGIIMIYTILSAYLLKNILAATIRAANIQSPTGTEKLDQKIYWNQSIGLDQKERKQGKKLAELPQKKDLLLIWFVRYAKNILKQKMLSQDFVQINAKQNGVAMQVLITLQKFVQLAVKSLKQASIKRLKVAPVSVVAASEPIGNQYVYDLTIKDKHEFYANGILVHNSRYALKNVSLIMKRYKTSSTRETLAPMVAVREDMPGQGALVGVQSVSSGDYSSERWRESLGGPATAADFGRGNNREGRPPWMP